jgi:hypothetical protein
MELLSNEFIELAHKSGLSDERMKDLIGEDFYEMEVASEQDLSWRKLPTSEELSVCWQVLKHPAIALEYKKINRRTVVQTYQMFGDKTGEILTLVGTTPHYTIRMEHFNNYSGFEHFATNTLVDYPAMDFQNTSIRHLSSEAFQVFTLLVELFIEKYPTPATDWEPDELLTFTVDSLTHIMNDSNSRLNEYTWWQHWKKLTNQTELTQDDFDLGIAQLAHKELIGFVDEVEGQDVYFIGKTLTWYVRGIVWWDKGFLLNNTINNTQFITIAASALFVIITEGNNDFSIFNVDGKTQQKYLKKYIEIALDSNSEKPSSKEVGVENSQPLFCSQCGNKLMEGAKFCSKCGYKI